jgi:hypothetical protein
MKKFLTDIHPLLIAIYPIVALRNFNIIYVDLLSIVRSIGISLLLTSLLWLLLRLFIGRSDRAGLVTTLAVILFFSYGHVYLQFQAIFGKAIRHSYLTLLFGAIFVLLSVLVLRLQNPRGIRQFLTVTAISLLGFSILQSASYDIRSYQVNAQAGSERDLVLASQTAAAGREQMMPDIYLIILDAHTRSDVLRNRYDHDDSDFIQGLMEMGFYVAECSQSNYMITRYSLTSLMNMDYLQNFTDMQSMSI